jgi:hypothetical protein
MRRTTGSGVATNGAINKLPFSQLICDAVFVSLDAYFFFEYQNGKFQKVINSLLKCGLLGNVLRLLLWSSRLTAFHAALCAEFEVFLLAV